MALSSAERSARYRATERGKQKSREQEKRRQARKRGESVPPLTENRDKTHCPAGHPYDEQNTYRTAKGHRRCRACHNERVKISYAADPRPARERKRQQHAIDGDRINARRRARDAARIDEVREMDRARYAASPRKREGIYSRRHSGMQPHEWAQMWQAQDGRCYLCGRDLPEDRRFVHVDHDHRCCPPGASCSTCRRGLACNSCNALIGHAQDDPARLRRIADALEIALLAVAERMNARPVQDQLFSEEAG